MPTTRCVWPVDICAKRWPEVLAASGFEWLMLGALIAVLLALAAAGCMVRLPELLDDVVAMLKVNQGRSVAPNA